MDHIEKISARDCIQQAVSTGKFVFNQRKRMVKLRKSPHFGRATDDGMKNIRRHHSAGPERNYPQ